MTSICPGNGIFVVQGEIAILMISMKKFHWSSRSYKENENNPLLKNLSELKDVLNQISDLKDIEPSTFLDPFLDVIRSVETSVQVTTLALSSINKFISYGLITSTNEKYLLPVIDSIADVVAHAAHANFIITDDPGETMILKKIVDVLRTLVLSPLGTQLSNDSICEIMLSCFKICFETRLNDLLRHSAESCLRDIVQFLFTRLPLFIQTPVDLNLGQYNKKMRMRPKNKDVNSKKKNKQSAPKTVSSRKSSGTLDEHYENDIIEPVKKSTISENIQTTSYDETVDETTPLAAPSNDTDSQNPEVIQEIENQKQENVEAPADTLTINPDADNENGEILGQVTSPDSVGKEVNGEKDNDFPSSPVQFERCISPEDSAQQQYVNSQGVRFMSNDPNLKDWLIAERIPLEPHNSICVQELLRFLALICNPYDHQNTDVMRLISLSLLTVALEVGAEAVSGHPSLLTVIKDTLCRNLLSLLNTERIPMQIFTATLQVSFLLFESMRIHLKFQLENFLTRLQEIIVSENPKISYDKKELALDTLVRLWRIPGFISEVYLNFDCGLYCSNLFEEITLLLSKSANPTDVIYNTHVLALNALLITVESIEKHCHNTLTEESASDSQIRDSSSTSKVHSAGQLIAIKHKKKLLTNGTQLFNTDPKKGIQFLQEQHLLSDPIDPVEVVKFLRENPHLDKKMLGDYITSRSNLSILEEFVRSFDFTEMRIDQALRGFLQSFRLPGESPLVMVVMQTFADHWHECNYKEGQSKDSIFQLAFTTIVLNTFLHNKNFLKTSPPMPVEGFKDLLKDYNDGKSFDDNLLETIYQSIKNEEIILPSEHTGLICENYLWELLLSRGAGKDGVYLCAKDGQCDQEIFSICWDPVVSALRFIFDKAGDSSICYKAVQGFRKCAAISAHYCMSSEFDTLIWSLCGFTTLMNSPENPESCTVSFGMNAKARISARTVFSLVHRHGDILRDGWRPVFECIFQLFRCKLLPKILVEAEDFLELSGKISLIREDVTITKSSESGLLSSLYSYITLSRDAASQRITSEEEKEYIEIAKTCVTECHLENLIQESKFLRLESLHELLKTLIRTCYNEERIIVVSTRQEEDRAVFFLELLIKVVIQNRDRISTVWQVVCNHLQALLMAASAAEQQFLIERCVIGLLRLAIRLMRRDEISSNVLQSLQMFLLLKRNALYSVSRQISYGLYELLKTGAANIHSEADWSIIFTLFEVIGAGAPLPKLVRIVEDHTALGNSGSADDSCIEKAVEATSLAHEKQHLSKSEPNLSKPTLQNTLPSCNSYLFHNGDDDGDGLREFYTCANLLPHDPFSLVKCCESLAFLVRDVAHITPFNFKNCVHTMRTFVEATLYAGERKNKTKNYAVNKTRVSSKTIVSKTKYTNAKNPSNPYSSDESDTEEFPDSYFQVPLQLLDLIDTLHTKTAHIHNGWTKPNTDQENYSLWPHGWCPLLQGIARLCCDPRKSVRMRAITYLQRALLMHDLQMLKANEWESCFNHVLFPLLEQLAEPFEGKDYAGVEETRMRAATLLSKVFLHHLFPLQLLPSFTNLWLRILDFMNRYMSIDKNDDLLNEAIQECVKNMVLVMESAQLFSNNDGQTQFWELTWARVDQFVPSLRNELFRYHSTARDNNDNVPRTNSSELSTNRMKESDVNSPTTARQENVDAKYTEASLVQHSVPLFPHMGQLISTPIGPPLVSPFSSVVQTPYENEVDTSAGYTQISSLVASAPEFLATLPSFHAQSPPAIYRNVDHCVTPVSVSPPNALMASATRGATTGVERVSPPIVPNVSVMTSPISAPLSSPIYVSPAAPLPVSPTTDAPLSYPQLNACPTAPTTLSADSSPQHAPAPGSVQRSSSICEAIVGGSYSPMVPLELTRTESVPALAAYSSPLNDSSAIPSSYTLLQQQPQLQTLHLVPPCHISAAQSSFTTTEACAAQSAVPVAHLTDAISPQSPQQMPATLPVYSGFAQLTTDGVRNAKESSAKQFFYQNW